MNSQLPEALRLFSPALPLAVAYSGGADSTALLLACADKWPGQVHAFHVHHGLQAAASVVIGRIRDGGWHAERLHVYNLLLAADDKPVNRDGEVQEFQLAGAAEVSHWVRANEFTPDAAAAIAQGMEAASKT